MRVIVHGGAGSQPDEPAERQQVLDEAADAGTQEVDPTGAVCAAVGVLEADPRFNAGVGSTAQSDGYLRTDAGLMTDDLEAGAVCGMPGVERAVEVARVVKEETPHVLVAGVHAVDLAAAFGIETDVDLWTDEMRGRWNDLDERPPDELHEQVAWVDERFGCDPAGDGPAGDCQEEADDTTVENGGAGDRTNGDTPADRDHDTVGAVATDGDRVAAATSTGGRWLALAGRVGDVPQIGSGFYCTPAGGASATGAGEDIARVTLTRRAVQLLESGHDADAAANAAVEEFDGLVEGTAGIIVMTPDGDAGAAYNSDLMQTAVAGDL